MHAVSESRELLELLEECLPVRLRHIPYRIRDVSRTTGMRVALVGGIPRDLLRIRFAQLERELYKEHIKDFDMAVEGDGVKFAYELARRIPGELVINEAFKTAKLTSAENPDVHLDITTARTEYYPQPGHLPEVITAGATLEQDQQRRDFTINALSLEISDGGGDLIDTIGGAGDIKDQFVRVLHPQSFVDDPTRMIRALRYTIRFKYELEPTTLELYQDGVQDMLPDLLTPERIRYELERACEEEKWHEIWAVMDLSRLTDSIFQPLGGVSRDWQAEDAQALDIAMRNHAPLLERCGLQPWFVRTAWVLRSVMSPMLRKVSARIGLGEKQIRMMEQAREILRRHYSKLSAKLRPSQLARLLDEYSEAGITLAMLTGPDDTPADAQARSNMLHYIDDHREVKTELTGNDVIALGLPKGPKVGNVLRELRYLKLDGVAKDKDGEMNLARKLVKRHSESASESNTGDESSDE